MHSLRRRLIVGTTVGTAIVLAAAGVLLYSLVRAGLLRQFERSMIDKARLLASTVEVEFGVVDLEFEKLDMREFEGADGPGYMQLWLDDGSVAFRSPSLAGRDLKRFARPAGSPAYRWLKLPNRGRARGVGIVFRPRAEYEDVGVPEEVIPDEPGLMPAGTITLVLARDTSSMDRTLARLRTLLLVTGCLAVALSAGVLWLVIRRSLRPIDQVAAEINRLGEEDLSARLEAPNAPKEIQPVTERLNDLLGRLEIAFRRERSFSSNVAHELRTPLAGLRSMIEVALSRPRGGGEYREALSDSLQVTTQMQAMVEKLLSLARLDAGQVRTAPQSVAINDLVRACWAPLADCAEARRLRIQWELGPPASVVTDPSLLEVALRNVLENAVAHADDGGSVRIETVVGGDRADIRVTNTGSTLPQEEAERVFERFWRGDAARTAAGVHSGLGLSLVKKIAEVLGGAARVRSRAGGEFEITLSIPERRSDWQDSSGRR